MAIHPLELRQDHGYTHYVRVRLNGEVMGSTRGVPCASEAHARKVAQGYEARGPEFTTETRRKGEEFPTA